ncbi:membrane protein [Mycobacterium phage Bartimeaus]|uniref:Uncharacterized protein n=67 Tax=Backyardiganvirus TaxID=2946815 RepID=A0A1B1SED4_9CAUD|nr:hypothetical protein PEACHES_63 [Mycobacterium phage Peaches]YP_009005903.1 hypothetical protein PBI_NYXIS_64 [Mycobacterium phage Nyxis]YP_009007258.1 hypothetical protein PBI_OBAMA12_66 [Mycobacterium phage Obama12]YP_009018852.1 hypothetical protein LHTSCC_67 [Mycobacterium phage LHTSCC]YP_009031924.1 hypothetical protein PBI_KAMPY_64 [Mycobacterium phage Kampy]YP_010062539.1 hypothetical protein KIY69_gp66 [Mycobacterium phage Cerulean]YP_010062705.1 hypothetical protein KIY71_gp65 [My
MIAEVIVFGFIIALGALGGWLCFTKL